MSVQTLHLGQLGGLWGWLGLCGVEKKSINEARETGWRGALQNSGGAADMASWLLAKS